MGVMDDRRTFFKALIALLLAALTAAIYINTLGNGFVYDDNSQIIRNPWIKDVRYLPSVFATHSFGFIGDNIAAISYRPMVFVVYMIEYAAFGLQPWGWHLISSVLHAINSIMVFSILSRLLRGYRSGETGKQTEFIYYMPQFFGAALFAAHPVNSEPVSWVGCVPELFYTFLCLTILYTHIKTSRVRLSQEFNYLRYSVLTGVLFFFAVLFKETAIFLPVLLLVYDRTMVKGTGFFSAESVKSYMPYGAAAGLYLAVRLFALGHVAPGQKFHTYLTFFQYLLNSPVLLVEEFITLVFPNTSPFQLFDPVLSATEPEFLLSIALLCFTSVLVIRYWKKVHPLYLIALFLMLLPLIPTLYSPAISRFPFADRYLYFPSIGFSLFLSLVLKRFMEYGIKREKKVYIWGLAGFFASVAIFFSWSAEKRSLMWKDDLTLWSASAEGDPDNYYAFYNIGIAHFRENRMDEGIQKMEKSLDANRFRAHPDKAMLLSTLNNLARAYKETGQVDEAERRYYEILRFSPGDPSALLSLESLCREKMGSGGSSGLGCKHESFDLSIVSHRAPFLETGGDSYGSIARRNSAGHPRRVYD